MTSIVIVPDDSAFLSLLKIYIAENNITAAIIIKSILLIIFLFSYVTP